MSLLNDMLRDLNSKTSPLPTFLLNPTSKKYWIRKMVPHLIFTLILIIMISIFVYELCIQSKSRLVLTSSVPPALMSQSTPLATHDFSMSIGPSDRLRMDKQGASDEDPFDNRGEAEITTPTRRSKGLKIMSSKRSEDWYHEHLNEALEAIQNGNDQRATDLLTFILTQFPASIEARENLAALYLSHNELMDAYEILDEGLRLEPYNINFITMKARLLVEQEQPKEALTLLGKVNPDVNSAPEYYALQAAIFESLGRTNEAGSIYQSLVKVEPSNGKYWLGLGVALEHKHSTQQAIEAYKLASQSENAQPSVRAYAESRLNTLQG
jgi:MSHA biogenesis protein MshN